MKKLLCVLLITAIIPLAGCGNVVDINYEIKSPDKRIVDFEVIDNNFYNYILVDRTTGVLYLLSSGTDNIIPIYNADGSLKLYEEYFEK